MSALEVNAINDTTLLISWGEPVSPNGNILSYSINITDLRDDSIINRETIDNTNYTVTNLGKYKEHYTTAMNKIMSFRTRSTLWCECCSSEQGRERRNEYRYCLHT